MVAEGTTAPTGTDLGLSLHPDPPSTGLAALPEQPGRDHDDDLHALHDASGSASGDATGGGTSDAPGDGPGGALGGGGDDAPGGGSGDVADVGPSRPRHRTADLAAELFRRWTAGDTGASRELVDLLTPTLWHTARAYRLDAATAEDVVQNAWLALARRQDHVRDPQAVLAWLMVTVRRDAARTAALTRAAVPDPDPVLAVTPDTAAGPARTVLEADEARRLWAAVARLPERCQRLLRVVAFSDRPDYASLSADLGMPVGSIGPTRGRCLKKLRDDLDGQGGWTT